MTILHGLILGLIEGLTEFLPISSTAHLILISEWLRIPSSDFLKTFEISIQLGAILAVVVLYWKKIWNSWNLILKIGAAFLPTAIIGLIFYKTVKTFLMNNLYIISSALIIGGLILILFEKYYSKKTLDNKQEIASISYTQAIIVGCCQSLAIIPGVSRAAATIIGGLSLGISRKNIVEFSFLLAIPTMLAATILDLYKTPLNLTSNEWIIWLIGFITAFITAIIGVKFFLKFIQKNNFSAFGWYRIGLGIVALIGILYLIK